MAIKKLHNNPPPFSNFQVAQLLLKNKLMYKMDLKHRFAKYFKSFMTFNTGSFNYGFSFFYLNKGSATKVKLKGWRHSADSARTNACNKGSKHEIEG